MKSLRLEILTAFAAWAFALGYSGASIAQSEPEEELELIEIGNVYGDEDATADEEIFDGLVFDQNAQQYRLIEDPEEEDLVEPPTQRETDTKEIVRLFKIYKQAVASRNFLEADTLAKQIVELSIRVFGIESVESAKSLTNLAIAQHGNKEYEAAERNYVASINIIERISDRLNEALINPLKGLGATQLAIGFPSIAQQTFQRAVHISHVNNGPHNKGQIDVLESMAEIHIATGEHKQALSVQAQMYSIQSRNIEPFSLELLPALKTQAHWQHRLQMYDRERITWRKVIQVIERHHGKEDLQLIPPLTSLGTSYLFVTPVEYDMQPEISVTSGESYLRRANRIADINPATSWQILEQTLLALGDYYVLSGRPNRASRIYAELWTLLSDDEASDEEVSDSAARLDSRRSHLEKLNILQDIYPPKYYSNEKMSEVSANNEEFETGTVTHQYTVNSSGRIINIMHVETQPPEFDDMQSRVRRNLRHIVYRPRIEEGRMVGTTEVVYTHEFYYRSEDIPVTTEIADPASR